MAIKWTLLSLTEQTKDENWIIKYLTKHGLIPESRNCPKCGKLMVKSGMFYRCYGTKQNSKSKGPKARARCNTMQSIKKNKLFGGSKLTMQKYLQMTYLLLRNCEQQFVVRELEINKNTVSKCMTSIRKILVDWSLKSTEKIGGDGKIVEIDETKFGSRKYNRGYYRTKGQWVFGGLERGSGKFFMVPVEKRDEATLLKIIKQWIQPGTTIISDMWKAYNCLGSEGYKHLTVNHSIEFKNPDTGAHINGIEGTWRHAKYFLPEYCRKKQSYAGYFAHFMFQKKCKSEDIDELETFIKACIISDPEETPK